ncbi:uncharacterized protein PV07_11866 [Cladophialophora immunda]|uniref:DUF6594 domain-containing protein n=1 Tax=Cladophialophora immunda TaxID=569365 RepID=A0A0D1Z7R8_9EURO|nr:uncharacterized protein PV07_11866 [Cladophialophora immunda]KIW23686.1 hypothetical protein PV07_11866 [Cladophialophora immunda]
MDDYSRLSSVQAGLPEFAIFRRFMPLQALQLNVLQAEIAHLRQGLGLHPELERKPANTEKWVPSFAFDQAQTSGDPPPSPTLRALWDRLDAKLERYNNALLHYRAVSQLPSVDPLHHRHLRRWNLDLEGGHGCFHGVEAAVWDEENAEDLTSIAMPTDHRDPLTYFLHTRFLPWYHSLLGHKYKQRICIADAYTGARQQMPIYSYSDKLVLLTVNICSTVLSSMIPSLCSLALYFIQRGGARIGAIVGFTFLFSIVTVVVTPAKRIETFVATAAFAAVLIVFVGNGT